VRERVAQVAHGADSLVFPALARRAGGTPLPVQVVLSRLASSARGQAYVLVLVRDLGEHALAYEALEARVAERTREIERRRQIAEALRHLLAVVNSGRSVDEMLRFVISQAVRLLGANAGVMYMADSEEEGTWMTTEAAYGVALEELPRRQRVGSPISGLAVSRRRAVACPDLLAGLQPGMSGDPTTEIEDRPGYIRVVRVVDEHDTPDDLDRIERVALAHRAILAVPLAVHRRVYGALTLLHAQPREFSDEEIQLALTFGGQAGLVLENAHLHAEAGQRLREIQSLYRADEALHRSLRLDDVLQALVDEAAEMLQAEKTSVLVWDDPHERLAVRAAHGFLPESIPRMSYLPGEGISTRVASSGEPLAIEDVQGDSRVSPRIRAINEAEGIRSVVSVPIKLGDVVFGVFNVNCTTQRIFSSAEQRLLLALAQRAALAIENARLFEHAQDAAALQERQRLARELHDAVTQTLFSASLIAEVLPGLWNRDRDAAGIRLAELRNLTRGALAEMRTLLLELRPTALAEIPLDHLVRQLADATRSRAHVVVDVHTEGASLPLPVEAKVALYRLVQEALNNIVKHAKASQAHLDLTWGPDAVQLCIADDGRGFDVLAAPSGHLGLGIMRERAAGIGACLDIESRPGAGTRVTITWPAP
jgi:nitrate/nitrite-specific signal transduction histidine kinase